MYSRNRRKDYIELILSGKKTVDIKLYFTRIAPYNKLHPNDLVYIKESGGPVVGSFQISNVAFYEIHQPPQILRILEGIQSEVGLDDSADTLRMYAKTKSARYVTVFGIKNPYKLSPPILINKHDRRVWVTDFQLERPLVF